jgi:YVTN family beta-propeller protein
MPNASESAPKLPGALDEVLERGTAKVPDERWPTCAALVEAARSALGDGAARVGVRRRSRRAGIAAALTGAAAVAAVLAVLLLGGGGTALAQSDSLVRIDADGGRAATGVAVGPQPTAVTVCAGSVWVTTRSGIVSQVDPSSLTQHRVRVPGRPTDVADVGELAAVVSGPPEQLTIIDAQFGQISDVVELPDGRASATAVAFGRDVWVANPSGRRLDLLAPPYTAIGESVPLPGSPRLVAAGEGAVWAVGGRTLWRVDPGARRVVASVRLAFAPTAIAAGRGGVWLADEAGDAVVRVDPANGRPVRRVVVGDAPVAIAVGAEEVWVANRTDGTVSRIDPGANAVDKSIRVGGAPIDVVAGLGAVWLVRQTG